MNKINPMAFLLSLLKGGPSMIGKPRSSTEFGKRTRRRGSLSSGKMHHPGGFFCGYPAGSAKKHKKQDPVGRLIRGTTGTPGRAK
jgi:hypothetical protein